MRIQLGLITLVAALCGAAQAPAADEPARSAAQVARDETQKLLKDRDEARPKAKAAEQKLRESGYRMEPLGFESAKALRDQATPGAKATAYDRYAQAAKQIEKQIQDEVRRGVRPILCQDIARFEQLQAEVDLARILGRLPAEEK